MRLANPNLELTTKIWTLKLMLGAIDSSYDEKDELTPGSGGRYNDNDSLGSPAWSRDESGQRQLHHLTIPSPRPRLLGSFQVPVLISHGTTNALYSNVVDQPNLTPPLIPSLRSGSSSARSWRCWSVIWSRLRVTNNGGPPSYSQDSQNKSLSPLHGSTRGRQKLV